MSNPYGSGQPQWGQPQPPGPYSGYGQQGGYGNYPGYGQPGGYGNYPGYGQPGGYGYPGYGQPGGYGRPVPAEPSYGVVPASYGQYTPVQRPGESPQSGSGGSSEPPRKKRSALPWVFGGLVLLIVAAVVLVLGFVAPGWFVRDVFDAHSVEMGVKQTLADSYRIGGVESVSCPSGEPVEPGHSFVCDVHVSGAAQAVTVTVKDQGGIYEVSYPR